MPDDFNALMEARFETCKKVLSAKSDEYSTATDKLHNFKVAAKMQTITPESALRGMWTKHLVSMLDIIRVIEYHGIIPTKELLNEKVTDVINYTVLLEALIEERRLQGAKK